MYTLRTYQQDAVNSVYEHLRTKDTNPCVVIPTAGGKTICIAQVAKDAATVWNGRVMILAHVKELVEQNAAKLKSICPALNVGVYSAGLSSRDTDEAVVVAGIQSVYNKIDIFPKPFDLIMIDECFPSGTLVATPHGEVPIEDVAVGTKVFNANGIGVVQCTSARLTEELIELELENGDVIRCTPNHPVFADGEWHEAGSLGVGARLCRREDLPGMQPRVPSADALFSKRQENESGRGKELAQAGILFTGMCGETSPQIALVDKRVEEMRVLRKNYAAALLQERRPNKAIIKKDLGADAFLLNIMCQTRGESSMGEAQAEAYRQRERREWTGDAESASDAFGIPERLCHDGNGVRDDGTAAAAGQPELLQDRCGNSIADAGCGTGRGVAQGKTGEACRCEEEKMPRGIRVVRIAHIKCAGGTPVYNLQVSGHPSYFAGGVLVHNCHLIPNDGEGRYRTFLEVARKLNPNVRLIGWTATPYRTQGGLICKPENLLNEICYEIGIKELINQGYISKITARAGKHIANTDGLHVRMGEFVSEDVERVMGEERLVSSACREIVEYAKDRQACLIFCTSVAHCRKVAKLITQYSGEECAIVTGDTPDGERDETIRRLRGETVKTDLFAEKPPLKFCCNVSVLTTGTDIPRLDTIALLRPTMSPGLLVQMVGRGFRLSPETGKRECIVLDYGRNIERHGPIDMIHVKEKTPGKGEPLAKTCPECQRIVPLSTMLCPECGHEWPRKEREEAMHEATAANTGILSGEVTISEYPVVHTEYREWRKRGAPEDAPRTVRVSYSVDFLHSYSEWLCPEHTGYARRKFEKWWREHANPECPMPMTADDVCEFNFMGMIREVKSIKVKSVAGQKYPEIISYELGDYPVIAQDESTEDIDYDDVPF